jgi:hypothetical protein
MHNSTPMEKTSTTHRIPMPLLVRMTVFAVLIMTTANVAWGQAQSQSFTSNGTFQWLCPPGVTSVTVKCYGAGGAGGQRTGNGGGGGGGGGAYASSVLAVTPGTIYTVVVGSGGASGNPSTPGGDSYFNSVGTVMAKGGSGVTRNNVIGAAGGQATSSVGSTKWNGGTGGTGSGSGGKGGGGAGTGGAGQNGGNGTVDGAGTATGGGNGGNGRTGSQGNGTAGSTYGGGGGGGYRTSSSTREGGAGASGAVILEWNGAAPAETVNMTSGSTTTCGALFYDSGGLNSNYTDDQNRTLTFLPASAGDKIKITFISFNTEVNYDGMMIYDGNSTSAPLISSGLGVGSNGTTCPAGSWRGSLSGATLPRNAAGGANETIISTAADGSITINFRSDGSTTQSGWVATVTCFSPNLLQVPALTGTATITCGQTTTLTPYMPTGGTISNASSPNSDWRMHSFNSNANFTTDYPWNACVLVVAGGGGGGANTNTSDGKEGSGGGGAGGVVQVYSTIAAGSTSATIGNGGSAGSGSTWPGAGGNSTFGSIVAIGGGRGARGEPSVNHSGGTGGSGGGATRSGSAGQGTFTQGHRGGTAVDNWFGGNAGGGGGGAGRVGSNGSESNGGAGGDGIQCGPNGILGFFGGGGGGGAGEDVTTQSSGGNGGGGNGGSRNNSGNSATANTGGGGGGAGRRNTTGGAGGSGAVRVVYLDNSGGTWSSDDNAVATVNSSGVVTAQGQGTATITYSVTKQGITASRTRVVTVSCPTISTGAVSGSAFCAGSSVSVPFTVTGTYNSGNVFTAQLSNASGNFTAPFNNIGTLSSTSAGTISATIPSNTPTGSGYRIRVVSSNPPVTGTVNGADLTITAQPNATISYAGPFCTSAAVQNVTRTGTAGGAYSSSPDGLTINSSTGAITPSSSSVNTYTVTYTIAASDVCAQFSTTASVGIQTLTANAGGNITACGSGAAPIISMNAGSPLPSASNASAVSWNIGGSVTGWSGSGLNPTAYSYAPSATSGPATATLSVTGTGACGSTVLTDTRVLNWNRVLANAGGNVSQCGNAAYTVNNGASVTGPAGTTFAWTVFANPNSATITNTELLNNPGPTITPTTPTGSVTLRLTATGPVGSICDGVTHSNSMTFTWTAGPEAVAGPPISQCGGADVYFTGSSASAGSTFSWSVLGGGTGTGDIITGDATDPATWGFDPTTPSGSITVRLSVTSAGCGGTPVTSDRTITWDATPTVSTTSPLNSCTGTAPVSITGVTAGGTFSAIGWSETPIAGTGSFTANQTTVSPPPQFTPTSGSGQYSLVVTLTGSGACLNNNPQATMTLNWDTPPVVDAGIDQSLCANAPFNLSGSSITGAFSSVAWTRTGGTATGDFTANSSSNPDGWVWTPTSAGTATFQLAVTGSGTVCGSTTVTDSRTITFDALPAVNAGSDIAVCTGTATIAMTGASVTGPAASSAWTGGSGVIWVQNATPALASFNPPTANGSFTATLTAAGAGACSSEQVSDSRQITWNSPPVISQVAYTDNISCDPNEPNGAIFVNASGSSFITLSIDNGANYSGNFQPASLVGGSYNIVVKDANNCTTSYINNPVVLNNPAAIVVSAVEVTQNVTCGGGNDGQITITDISGGAQPYQYGLQGSGSTRWFDVPPPINEGDPTIISNLPAGTYNIIIRDAFGCESLEYAVTITEPTPITISNISVTDINGCGGSGAGAVSLTASGGTGTLNYYLNGSINTPATNSTFNGLNAGAYEVEVRDATGCSQFARATITAPWFPTAGNDIEVCSGESVQLNGGIVGEAAGCISEGTGTGGYAGVVPSLPFSYTGPFGSALPPVGMTWDINTNTDVDLCGGTDAARINLIDHYITIGLGSAQPTSLDYVLNRVGNQDKTLIVEHSVDGASWTTAETHTQATVSAGGVGIGTPYSTPIPTTARFIRFNMTVYSGGRFELDCITVNGSGSNNGPLYCVPLSSLGCSDGDGINNFSTTNGIANISRTATGCNGNATGYIDYADMVEVIAGNSFDFSLDVIDPAFVQGVRIWIDYNNNGVFEASESVWVSSNATTSFTGTITIPANQIAGIFRMRVRTAYNAIPTAGAGACGSIRYSETEDYRVKVNGFGVCSPTYSWSPATELSNANIANPTILNASANTTYTLTVNDGAGCVQTSTVKVNVSNLTATNSANNVSCNGVDDGCITVTPTNGIGPYLLYASTGDVQVWGGRMRTVTVTNTPPNATLSNHQVEVNVPWAATMRSDFGDIRFFDANQNPVPYWVESYTLSGTAKVWLKVPSVPASGSATLYMVYGNNTLTTQSNGAAVFEFFDDFAAFNAARWSATGAYTMFNGRMNVTTGSVYSNSTVASQPGMMVEAKVNWANFIQGYSYSGLCISNTQSTQGNNNGGSWVAYLMSDALAPTNAIRAWGSNAVGNYDLTGDGFFQFSASTATEYILGYDLTASGMNFYNNRTLTQAFSLGSWANPFFIYLGHFQGSAAGTENISDISVDWVLVRKKAASVPTVSFGPVVTADNAFCGLAPNTYTIDVVDVAGCTDSETEAITEPDVLVITSIDVTNTWCYNNTQGALDITVNGGTPNYVYNWAGPSGFSSNNADNTGLAAGIYNVTVADDNACTASSSATVGTTTPLNNGFYTWTGNAGATTVSWDEVGNWDCGLPDQDSRVIIPAVPVGGATYLPIIYNSITAECYDIDIQTTGTPLLEIQDGGILQIGP